MELLDDPTYFCNYTGEIEKVIKTCVIFNRIGGTFELRVNRRNKNLIIL